MTGDRKQKPQSSALTLRDLLTSTGSVSVERIREGMETTDLETQSELFDFVMNPERVVRVVPELKFEDYQSIASRYLTRCIIEDPPQEVAHSRWTACYEFASWFRWLWEAPSIPKSAVAEAKQLLRRLYLEGDSNRRQALVQGTLEHLFENPSVKEFFSDWTTAEPELHVAYDQASEWSHGGAHSHFWEKTR